MFWNTLPALIIGGVVVVLLLVIEPQTRNDARITPVRETTPFCEEAIPLGDRFLCLVRVEQSWESDQPDQFETHSRVRIVDRAADRDSPCLLEVVSAEFADSLTTTRCRLWTIMSRDEALRRLPQPGLRRSALDKSELLPAGCSLRESRPYQVQSAAALEEPVLDNLPWLRESDYAVITSRLDLNELPSLKAFPIEGLRSAIESASEQEHWSADDPTNLLPGRVSDEPPSASDQSRLAQSLLQRLLDHLRPEGLPANGH